MIELQGKTNRKAETMKSLGARPMVYPSPVWCIGSYDVDGKPKAGFGQVLEAIQDDGDEDN